MTGSRRSTHATALVRRCRSAREMERIGRAIGRRLRGGDVLALRGELGSGKTTLVRGLAAGLGAPPRRVSSPTFVFVHLYEGRLRLAHVDLYRLADARPADRTRLETLGLDDYRDERTVMAIEWPEYGAAALPADRLEIALEHQSPRERLVRISGTGARSAALMGALRSRRPPRRGPARRRGRRR